MPITSVRIQADKYKLGKGESTTVHFRFNETPRHVAFNLVDDCTTMPSGTRWTSGLTRDPDDSRHYWATLSADDDTASAGGRITIEHINLIADETGDAGSGVSQSDWISVDTVNPRLRSITLDDTRLQAGETTRVRFVFNEIVTGASVKAAIDLSNAHGTLGDPYSIDGGGTWIAVLTPTANTVNAEGCKIGLNVSQVRDAHGNAGQDSSGGSNPVYSGSYTVSTSTLPPSLAADAITFSNSLLTLAAKTSVVTLTFSEPVKGLSSASLQLPPAFTPGDRGTLSAPVAQSPDAKGHSAVWTATLTAPGTYLSSLNVEDYKITVNLAGVTDRDDLQATTNRVESSNTYAIDVRKAYAVFTMSDTNLGIGEVATVTVSFNEKVTDFTLDDIRMDETTSLTSTRSDLVSIDDRQTWTFRLTPDPDSEGQARFYLRANSVYDLAGNTSPNTSNASTASYSVDHTRPTLTSSRITYATGETNSTLDAGETATVTFVFSEAVTGVDNSRVVVAYTTAMINQGTNGGTLSNPVSTDGGTTWTATLTAPTGNNVRLSNLRLGVDMSQVIDAAGNAGTGIATTTDFQYNVDTSVSGTRPTATIVLADTSLTLGETTTVTIAFSEHVNGFDATDVNLTDANGTLGALTANADGKTWTATFTPTGDTQDATNTISVNLAGVTNDTGRTGAGNATSSNYTVDTTRPTATITLADRALTAGETTIVTITFSKPVTDFDANDIVLSDANGTLGPLTTNANYTVWMATFTPTANVNDATNTIRVNLSGVTDAAGNAGVGNASSANYTVDTRDTTPPALASATVNGNQLVLTYTETNTLDAAALAGNAGFAVSSAAGTAAITVNSAVVNGAAKTVTLTLSRAVAHAETVRVSYTKPATGAVVQDAAGNDAANFSDQAVTNNTPADTTPPQLITTGDTTRPKVTGDQLVLSFDDTSNLDANPDHKPAGGAFTVLVNGVANAVTNVSVEAQAKTVTLTLSTAVSHGQTVTVAYADPTTGNDTNAIQDTAGNDAASFAATAVTNNTPAPADTTPPVFSSAAVTGDQLVLSFDDTSNLDADATHKPASGAFTVLVNGVANAVTHVSVEAQAKTVTLTLSTAVSHGQSVTVAYADPTTGNDTNAIQDAAGNDAASFAATAVTNNTPAPADTTPPQLITTGNTTRPKVTGNQLVLSFSDTGNLDADPIHKPASGAFTVLVNGVANAVTSVSVEAQAKTVTLTLSTAVSHGQTVTVAYADPTTGNDTNAIQDTAGNDAASFAATAVTNNTPAPADTTPPQLITTGDTTRPKVSGDQLVLSFSDTGNLDADQAHKPAGGAFTVLVNGVANAVTHVSVDARAKTVTLTLSTAVTHGQTVTVAYADPTTGNDTNAIQDTAGNDAASFAATAVTNNTPAPADTTAPQLITTGDTTRPKVTGDQLVLSFSDTGNLDADQAHKPAGGAFTVLVNGVANAVTHVSVEAQAKTVTLTLSTAVSHGQTVTVAYADPTTGNDANAIQDAAGNDAASFAATAVTNNTPAPADTTAPQLITTGDTTRPKVSGDQLVLSFSDTGNLDADATHKPANGAFTVLVNGVANAVTNVSVEAQAKTVTLTLSTAVSHGQSVTVA
ncbi:hypothetical protein D8B22_18755, partial [Verminephrobacter aporrectodeae subsp. tuberculatae]|uniref:beta strand repeat-containing protein n=2 Tax=Verminephrobacter aporrectodeae TaxID=1110389 RepID=UPI0022430C5B